MLNQQTIKNMFPTSFYKRGLQYYNQFRVQKLTHNDKKSHWTAKVSGSKVYDVEIDLFEDKVYYYCNCSAYDEYESCKHTVAVLLEIVDQIGEKKTSVSSNEHVEEEVKISQEVEEKEKEKEKFTSQISFEMINMFSENDLIVEPNSNTNLGEQLHVEYVLKTEPRTWNSPLLSVELKVGIDRLYVVKNLKTFLKAIDDKEEVIFTKSFSYEPNIHYFEESDIEILSVLQDIYKSESFFSTYDKWGNQSKQKGLTIPPLFADKLISLLHENNCKLRYDNDLYEHFKWTNNEPPFAFSLKKQHDSSYLLDLQAGNNTDYLETYGYILIDNAIYKLSKEQQVIMNKLDNIIHLDQDRSFPIKKEQIDAFLSYVLPQLKKIGVVDVYEEVSNDVATLPLHAKFYLEQEEDKLSAKLEYHYGNEVIYPFNETETQKIHEEKIIIRDVEKERKIMYLIEMAAFKFNGYELFLDEEERIFSFLYDVLPKLEELATIYMTNEVKQIANEPTDAPSVNLSLLPNENFFEINFDFQDVEQSEVQQVLASIIEKKRYYRLQDGSFLPLEDEAYEPINNILTELNIDAAAFDNGHVTLPSFRSLQVDEIISHNKSVQYNNAFQQLISDIKSPNSNEFSLPNTLQADLREYQITGFQWLKALSHYRFGGILADDMGLGKTLQAIAFLLSEWEELNGELAPALVVSPASLVYNWKNELTKFAPNLKVKVLHGNKLEREELMRNLDECDVLITSYPLVRQDIEFYKEMEFSTLILDEAQAIKNHMTKTARAIKTIRASRCFALSGTPIENSLDELWSIFDAILPGFFPYKKTFNTLSQNQISKMSRPFILRRLKKDVLTELPDKIETVNTSELTNEQKQLYIGYLEKIQSEASEALNNNGFQKNRMKILAGLTRLRQLCCHPSLFIENYDGESGKMNQLLEMVDNALENKQRILIFSQFSSMLKIIQKQLNKLGKEPFYLDGSTPSKDRVEMAERFNQGEKDIFLISLKAGGTGLNLTGADTVILYDLWWNPAVEEQATGRAHRMGQKKVVQVFRLITNGTIEEKIYSLQQKKKELIENIIHPGETMFSSLTEEEIRELLSV